ncbi:hypothetical protein OIU83_09200 [Flavobacterium sp. LS1R49]|uniref:Uncharacterized protein n=1 Tax=Flavobacterium shii TaxID=2987687 RepID=A0A9X2ZFV4_9FLAO|nr:hypothetical protein [Flavobacterium shii]MCV9927827.1 hypothetical protein [Flavobacterium shii]
MVLKFSRKASGYLSDKKKMVKGNYTIYPEKAAAGLWTNPTALE